MSEDARTIDIPVSIIADDGSVQANLIMQGSVGLPLDLPRHLVPGNISASVQALSKALAPFLRPDAGVNPDTLLEAVSIMAVRSLESMRTRGKLIGPHVLQIEGGRTFLSSMSNWELQTHVLARQLRFTGGIHSRMSEHDGRLQGLAMLINLEDLPGVVELNPEIWASVYTGMPQDQKDKLVAEAWSRLAPNDAQHLLNVRENGIQTHAELSMAREVSEWLIDLSSRRWHSRK